MLRFGLLRSREKKLRILNFTLLVTGMIFNESLP